MVELGLAGFTGEIRVDTWPKVVSVEERSSEEVAEADSSDGVATSSEENVSGSALWLMAVKSGGYCTLLRYMVVCYGRGKHYARMSTR